MSHVDGDYKLAKTAPYINVESWGQYLNEREDKELVKEFMVLPTNNKPLGSKMFYQKLEAHLGLCLTPKRRGRPALNK
ncbi:MAG: hypothetical protein ACI9Y8_002033 [Candidatus Omnitrophota bacterium]|jgi:hypothetical protein